MSDEGTSIEMKLAEALMERAALKTKLSQLSDRLNNNSKVYEGDDPIEDPNEMLEELDSVTERYQELVWRINTTNAYSTTSSGTNLAKLVAERDTLMEKDKILKSLIDSAKPEKYRYYEHRTTDMQKMVVTVDVRSIRKEIEDLSKHIREIDTEIQETNWNTELI